MADCQDTVEQIKDFAETWNELYRNQQFDEMERLATEDVGIANAPASTEASGLIFGRANYKKGIIDAFYGADGKQHNILEMQYEGWEYIPLNENTYYTIGRYTLQPNIVGVNCWLLKREDRNSPWLIYRVINN